MKIQLKNPAVLQELVLNDCKNIGLDDFMAVVRFHAKVTFSEEFCEKVRANRRLIERFLDEGRIIYGVTTGFGENVRYTIKQEDAKTLQKNIVRSIPAQSVLRSQKNRPGQSCS